MISALDLVVVIIGLAVFFFFMFRLGFMVGCNLTKKKLLPALSEPLQLAIDNLIAQYYGANRDPDYDGSFTEYHFSYQQVKTMLVIALINTRGEN